MVTTRLLLLTRRFSSVVDGVRALRFQASPPEANKLDTVVHISPQRCATMTDEPGLDEYTTGESAVNETDNSDKIQFVRLR